MKVTSVLTSVISHCQIFFFWQGNPLNQYWKLCLQTFLWNISEKQHIVQKEVHLYLYVLSEFMELSSDMMSNTMAANLTGHPSLTINAGYLDTQPVGLLLTGRVFEEVLLLQVASTFEKVRDESWGFITWSSANFKKYGLCYAIPTFWYPTLEWASRC